MVFTKLPGKFNAGKFNSLAVHSPYNSPYIFVILLNENEKSTITLILGNALKTLQIETN